MTAFNHTSTASETARLTLLRLEETGEHEPWKEYRYESPRLISLAALKDPPPPAPDKAALAEGAGAAAAQETAARDADRARAEEQLRAGAGDEVLT